MPDKKLTDNEIVKALECCSKDEINGLNIFTYGGVPMRSLLRYALDLINRQKAENERLLQKLQQAQKQKDKLMDAQMFLAKTSDEQQAENERLKDCIDEQDIEIASLWKRIEEAKSEARKEFAERLKHIIMWSPKNHISITAKDIDNLLKEMESANND